MLVKLQTVSSRVTVVMSNPHRQGRPPLPSPPPLLLTLLYQQRFPSACHSARQAEDLSSTPLGLLVNCCTECFRGVSFDPNLEI